MWLGRRRSGWGTTRCMGYLRFVSARARHNTLLAVAFDLKVFFTVVAKDPTEVTTGDVLGFIEAQRRPVRGGNVVRLRGR